MLPVALLVTGAANPCWISLPYFFLSCVGLLHWSMTCSAEGLSWYVVMVANRHVWQFFTVLHSNMASSHANLVCFTCKRRGLMPLFYFTGTHIALLYLHQVPLPVPEQLFDAGEYIGLSKVGDMGWSERLQIFSLLLLYVLVSFSTTAPFCSAV